MDENRKKSRRENDDGIRVGGLVNYDQVVDHQIQDKRFQREKAMREQPSSSSSTTATSSTFDAFKRMAAGLESRTLADKIADPNRPTWEQYKKDNEDKLDMVGGEVRKMIEYRAQLDKERERKLKHGPGLSKQSHAISDSEDENSENSSESSNRKRHKDDRKKSKKEKKHKKEKKKRKKRERSSSPS